MRRIVWMMAAGLVAAGCGPVDQIVRASSAPVASWSTCEITRADDGATEWWGVYGATNEPRGTTFTFVLGVGGKTTEYPMVAKAGSIYVNGKLYGHEDGYVDDGTNTNFGFTQADMPSLPASHGPASAKVTLEGETICAA